MKYKMFVIIPSLDFRREKCFFNPVMSFGFLDVIFGGKGLEIDAYKPQTSFGCITHIWSTWLCWPYVCDKTKWSLAACKYLSRVPSPQISRQEIQNSSRGGRRNHFFLSTVGWWNNHLRFLILRIRALIMHRNKLELALDWLTEHAGDTTINSSVQAGDYPNVDLSAVLLDEWAETEF